MAHVRNKPSGPKPGTPARAASNAALQEARSRKNKPEPGSRLTAAQRAANLERHRESLTKPGAAARVQHIKPTERHKPTPTQLSKAALGDDPHGYNHGDRGAFMRRAKGQSAASPARPDRAAPCFPPGETWPERGQCCWPTSAGRPWTFCRAPILEASRSGYCAGHESATVARLRPADQADAGAPGAIARGFTLPSVADRRGAGLAATRTAAAMLAQRGPRK